MRQSWFEDPDNVVYTTIAQFADNFGKEAGIPDLGRKIKEFRENPTDDGLLLKGTKRTAVKLFIPDRVLRSTLKWERMYGCSSERPTRRTAYMNKVEKWKEIISFILLCTGQRFLCRINRTMTGALRWKF